MFDDLSDLDSVDISEIKNPDNGPGHTSAGNHGGFKSNNSYGGGGNSYNRGNGGGYGGGNGGGSGGYSGGGGGFKRKEEVVEDPYVPVTMFIDREFPPEIKNAMYNLASKLINKKITVRYNGDDKEFHEKLSSLSSKFTEVYIPWKNFNEIESKHTWNTLTSKHLAQQHFQGWDKIPDSVKALMARNVRMIFGDKNNSVSLCLITWSKDGASKAPEVTKDTGRSSFIIKLTASYGFPVINMAKPTAENVLEKTFGL